MVVLSPSGYKSILTKCDGVSGVVLVVYGTHKREEPRTIS